MTPEQEATSRYLVEARNTDGSLVFPQFGGCWHNVIPEESEDGYLCSICRQWRRSPYSWNPDLFTWPSFGILWEGMQAREYWEEFYSECVDYYACCGGMQLMENLINPATFPFTVAAYLKGLK